MKEYEMTGTEVMEFTYLRRRKTTLADYALYALTIGVFIGFCYLISQHI